MMTRKHSGSSLALHSQRDTNSAVSHRLCNLENQEYAKDKQSKENGNVSVPGTVYSEN